MFKKKIFVWLFIFSLIDSSYAQLIYEKDPPVRIILNLTENPATSIAVTWRTNDLYKDSYAEIAEAGDWIDFANSAKKFSATIENVELDSKKTVFYYSALLNGLKPSTLYAYRVCSGISKSEWNQFNTANESTAPFTFLYFGDPQNDIKEHVSRIFRQAYKQVPDAAFWIFAGDLTTEPTLDSLWSEFFYAAGFIPRTTPFMATPGNHEYRKLPGSKTESKKKGLTQLWRPNFTFPENGIASLKETSYYFDYQGTRFIVLNGTENLDGQIPWLEKILVDNQNKWTIVTIHQPVYSTGKDRDEPAFREKLVPMYDKYSVDLVLEGHDHSYGRTYKLRDNHIVNDNQKGTVYVVSVSGPKAYDLNPKNKDLMVKLKNKIQLFQSISIAGNKLSFKSFTATGKLFDSFELTK